MPILFSYIMYQKRQGNKRKIGCGHTNNKSLLSSKSLADKRAVCHRLRYTLQQR